MMFPDTVQMRGVIDKKSTGRPELAVALIGNDGLRESSVTLPRAANVIVCGYLTAKVCVTGAAAA